jgi:hypothetical protein
VRSILLLAAASLAASVSADAPRGEWRTARPIMLPMMTAPGLVYLPLDAEALDGVESLSEYRIVGGDGTETPYRMVAEEGRKERVIIPAKIVSQATGRAGDIRLTLDLGPDSRLANTVRLDLAGDNFRARVVLEGAEAEGQAGLRLGQGLVYRHEGKFEQTRVPIPPHEQRFLRLTVVPLQGKPPKLAGMEVASEMTVPRKLAPAPARLSQRNDAPRRTTVLDLDLRKLTWDLAEAQFDLKEQTFDRPVTVKMSALPEPRDDDYQWAGDGRLRRLEAGRAVVLPLTVPPARWLRITIANGDDRPLTIGSVRLSRARRGLIFSADPKSKYELWYGRPGAAGPVYDIQRLPLTTPPAKLAQATLGPAREMPLKPPAPPPWSERHPALFWAMLVVVLALLTLLILKTIRGMRSAGAG